MNEILPDTREDRNKEDVAEKMKRQSKPSFDEYRKDHVDGKIKDNNGDPRNGGGNNKPDATLDELNGNGAKVEAVPVVLEYFDNMDYEAIYDSMVGVAEHIAPRYVDTLHDVAQQIVKGMSDLKDRLETLESERGWRGKTHDAAIANLSKSYDVPEELRKGALALGVLSEYYSQCMSTNKHNIVHQRQTYDECLRWYPNEHNTVKHYFNNFARDVMKNYYSPQIRDIANRHPAIGSTQSPDVGPPVGGDGNNGRKRDGHNQRSNHSPPPFPPPNVAADPSGEQSRANSSGGNDTPRQSFSPPPPPDVKSPHLPAEPGNEFESGAGGSSPQSGIPGGTPPTMPSLGAATPRLPEFGGPDSPALPSAPGSGATFDPSKVLTDPKSIAAADKLFSDPKTADAAKKLFGDPKLADAARTLFGGDAKGLLGDPKALDAARTLFSDPEAADAVKTLFGDPDTARAAQKLLNDPHLSDLSTALKDSGALREAGLPELTPVETARGDDSARSLLGPSALSPSDINNAARIPGVATGSSSAGGGSFISEILEGVNQIVQTAVQGAPPQSTGFSSGTPFEGGQGGPGNQSGGGSGGAAVGSGAGVGKPQLSAFGAPVAAANFSPTMPAGVLHPDIAPAQAGYPGGGAPASGGQGGGGKGGEGKDHKGNKALRSGDNGNKLIGQPDAVVSVIGEDGPDWGQGWNVAT